MLGKNLGNELRKWRVRQAQLEGVEPYRVLTNAVLDALALSRPRTKEEMLAIKGIKEARFARYGVALLNIIAEHAGEVPAPAALSIRDIDTSEPQTTGVETLSVSRFLDALKLELSGMAGRIRGEVSSVDVRERVVYFTLKDGEDESTLNCLIFRDQYAISGVDLQIGDEVVVEGVPDIYKPTGRLSLKVGVIELFGEGALKKAYDALFKKLETEGVFSPERKRPLPEFPKKIALVTSVDGAAIGDFKMNLIDQGFAVDLYPVSVEGKRAVFDILGALEYFAGRRGEYDVLVLIRGGGSLESLQAFNTEALARAVAELPIPTLVGVGHEKDVTLAALAADRMVSTPTAAAKELSAPWLEARNTVASAAQALPLYFSRELGAVSHALGDGTDRLLWRLRNIREFSERCERQVTEKLSLLLFAVRERQAFLDDVRSRLREGAGFLVHRVHERVEQLAERLNGYDPKRALALGYSLIQTGGSVLKDSSRVSIGDILDIQLAKGQLSAEVKRIQADTEQD